MFNIKTCTLVAWLLPGLLCAQAPDPKMLAKIAALEATLHQVQQQLAQLKQQVKPSVPVVKSRHKLDISTRHDWTSYHGAKLWQASAITTSSTLGTKTAFDGSDLLVATSSMQQDYHLLRRRRSFNAQRTRFHAPMVRPQVQLSGNLTVGLDLERSGAAATRQKAQVSDFELDLFSEINHDVFGYTQLAYKSDDADRIKLDRAFITWGDLDRQPWYVTAGQFYAPFGRYAAATVSSPMTKTMGRMKAKGALLGWAPQQGPYANVRLQSFFGHADVSKASRSEQINHWGWNMNWQHRFAHGPNLKTGLAYTNQMMNASMFKDWLRTSPMADASMLAQDYPGWDAYARVTWQPFQWNTEWVSFKDTITVNPTATKTTLLGQKPHAMYTELRYNTQRSYPGMLTVGFARTWGVDALSVPTRAYFLTDNMNLWKNTLQTIEWRLDRLKGPSKRTNRQIKCRFGIFF